MLTILDDSFIKANQGNQRFLIGATKVRGEQRDIILDAQLVLNCLVIVMLGQRWQLVALRGTKQILIVEEKNWVWICMWKVVNHRRASYFQILISVQRYKLKNLTARGLRATADDKYAIDRGAWVCKFFWKSTPRAEHLWKCWKSGKRGDTRGKKNNQRSKIREWIEMPSIHASMPSLTNA